MTSSPAEVWRAHIQSVSGRRCDLDVLLKDEWRHRVVARDDRAYGMLRQRVSELTGVDYEALKSRVRDGTSLGSLALAALHTALDSYGHGSLTVVAYSDLRGSVLPVVVDHQEQAQRSCAAAVADLDRLLADVDARLTSDEAFGRGLFDVALVLADRETAEEAGLPPVPLVAVVHDVESEGRLRWTFAYAAELFDDAVIGGVLDVAREVLLQLIRHPDELVREINLLSDSQRDQLLRWNATEGDFPQEKRLNELFEECAARFPDAEAVVYRDARRTYAELDRRANQLAHWLLGPEVGVTQKDLVALCLDKSDLGVVATLGIWKAGAAYVPVDPAYPADRIRFTIGDTRPAAVITNARHSARIRELLGDEHASVPVIEIEEVLGAAGGAARMPAHKPELGLDSSQLAYVTYTSGTTGVPKGVPKEHRSVVNSITDLSQRYDMLRPGTERVALYASYVFEPHLRQTLIALINGQTLVVVPDELRLDPDLFPAYLAEHGVTYLNATGSLLAHFDLSRCPELKRLLLVGEELTTAGLRRLREHFDGHIVNEYAFTESAFVTAVKEFAPGVSERTDRSIGRPLRNVTWYVLSQNLKQLPVGAIGELYIGGCGVAPGYLNREELTRGAFFANPYQSDEDRRRGQNERIYRTGDLARMLPNGEVEYLGRADFQLKINGVRIEPGEIEARATEFPGVRKCVVLAREAAGGNGERYLVGYYVADPAVTIAESELLDFLGERLIHVMVPARMVRLEQFPVNINGKVDWRALPEPEAQAAADAENADTDSSDTDSTGTANTGTDKTAAAGDEGLLDGIRRIWSAVLGVPVHRIAADDDFFRSGGQSISCILLVARIRRELHRDIAVEDVFRLRTPARLAERLAARPERAQVADARPEDEDEDAADGAGEVRLLANGLQQGLLYHSMKSQDGDDAYVVQSAMRYRTALDPELMREAWRHAQRKYPSLRLRFEPGQESFQVIGAEDVPLDWRPVDLSGIAQAEEQEAEIQRIQERDRAERYRPTEGGLFRVYLIKQRDDLYTVVLSCHHIIIDGWGLPVVHDEVHRAYLDLLDGVPLSKAVDRAYVPAQRYWQEHRNDHVEYWTGQIERIEERGDLAGLLNERSRYKVSLGSYDHVREHRSRKLRLGAELTAALTAACSAHRVTLHSMLQFVWHRTLHAIGGGRTTVVGTIVSGRDIPVDGIEDSVGLYINTLPLVVDHGTQGGQSVAEAVADIQSAVNVMNSKSVVEVGRLDSGAMKRQLFDSLLVLENYPRLLDADEERCHRERLRFEKDFDADRVDQPLALVGREEGDELTVTLWYAGELFDDSAVDTLLETARTLFEQVAADPTRPVTELEYLSESMAAELESRNRTETDFPGDRTLHAVFEEAAAAWPDAPALVFRDVHLSYRELNERANRLAHHLLSLTPLAADDLIALVVDKSEQMIIAILAVWKTGAGYVPVDPQFPDDRIAFMLGDTSAKLVLTNDAHADRLRALPDVDTDPGIGKGTGSGTESRPVLGLESLDLTGRPTHNPVTATTSTDLAYAIYTSGTTGRPKAVLLEHRGVVNLQVSLAKLFGLSKTDGDEALLSFSNYVFDHFVEQMTDALLNGQKLVVLDDALRTDAAGLCRYIDDNEVTYLSGTPSVLSLYDFSPTTSLRRIDAIGEDFSEPVFAKIRDGFDGLIINGYGPTEISITSHKRLYGPAEPRLDKSIGFPVANTACYVLNSAMKRVPVGGIGELYIGGDGVARGYLNRPDLTAERFLDNPFQTAEERARGYNARMYRTGDLCRWLPNGEVEYLGRTDLQVKIRGQRVELGEIESVLASVPGVTRALVVAREHRATGASVASQKYLVGFYIGAEELPEQDVKEAMRQRLSEALVPTRIIRIADIPVTPSGKLDVKRLPETDFAPEDSVAYVAPASDVEIRVCRIWAQVLGVEPNLIGANDDFFALGGDSIRAMALAQAVTSAFGGGFGVAAVFRNTTLAAQARYIQDAVSEHTPEDADALGAVGLAERRAGRSPVSLAQERLLFIDEFEGGTAAYNIPFTLRIPLGHTVSAQAVEAALRVLVGRHAALRTLIQVDAEGARCQQVLPATEAAALFSLPSQQLDGEGELDGRAQLDAELVADAGYVFRLDAELPLRARLYRLGGATDELWLSLVFHHTCLDGWSWDVFRSELAALLGGGSEAGLPALRASYADFAVWQRQFLTGRQLAELTEYWTGALAGFEPVRLPLDRPRPARFDYRGREVPFVLDARTTEELRALARSARVSLYSVLLGAWCLMLAAYSGQDDLVVGTPSANRGRPEFAGVVGFMANLLAVRVGVDRGVSLTDYLRAVGAAVVAAQVHGELPFEQLVKELGVGQDPSRHPVVQVNFTLMQGGGAGQESEGSAELTEYQPDNGGWTSVKFDLSAILYEKPDGISGLVTYAASLFEDAGVDSFLAAFHRVLAEFVRFAPQAGTVHVAELAWVDDEPGADTAVAETAATGVSPVVADDGPRTLHALFERVAAERPDAVAVVCGQRRLTYRELDERANRLAHQLRATVPLSSGDMVALVLDKSELTVVAILATWKAGAGYLPIDPGYPDDRIAFMLADTGARLVLANEEHRDRLSGLVGDERVPVLGMEWLPLDGRPFDSPAVDTSGADPAYAIYTSGTTGRPKAVRVPHRAALGFHAALQGRYFEAGVDQGVLYLANYVFDFSVEQFMLGVLSGNTLIVPPPVLDEAFLDAAGREGLSYVSGTPTQITQIDLGRLPALRAVLVAGEAFLPHHFEKIRREFQGPLFNAYGTTETTVYNTVRPFAPGEEYRNDLGAALPNSRLYVLDDARRPLPPGAAGELYLAGECVADGYLNRPELTAERFLPNHLRTAADRDAGRFPVLYRTGDVVRRRADGELRYLGRNDSQVKIRGVRIELGEVEAAIAACPGVRESAVVVRDDERSPGARRLVGYYVPEAALTGAGATVDDEQVLASLRATLMPSMVPSLLVRLDRPLPMTINGKVDTAALPDVEFSARRTPYVAPRSRTEARLCRLWSEQLPTGVVGIDDDFFRSGGDSISALRLASRIQRATGRPVSVKDVFDHPTVRALAERVLTRRNADAEESARALAVGEQGRLTGDSPMLPIQRWFFNKPVADRARWNQNFAVRTPALDPDRLRTALGALLDHHDAFFLRFRNLDSDAVDVEQFYAADRPPIVLHEVDIRQVGEQGLREQLDRLQSGFDLEHGPVFTVGYLHGYQDGSARVWFAPHHLVVDVVSWRILAQDLEILYHGGSLGPKGASYRQWAEAVARYRPVEGEAELWEWTAREVADERASTPSAGGRLSSSREEFTLDRDETEELLTESSWAYDTDINDLLLTAVGYALRTVTGRPRNHVTVEGHGREQFDGAPDVRDTVGWFTTMHPVPVEADPDLGRAIGATRANRRRVPHHGLGYGALRGVYGGTGAPLPPVSFNYLGRLADEAAESAPDAAGREPWRLDGAAWAGAPIGGEGAGDSVLDITMSCIDGRLVAVVDSKLDAAVTRGFAEELNARLRELIRHTAAVARTGAGRARGAEAQDVFVPHIQVNEEAEGRPLFLLPPGEGGAESYLGNIAGQLPGTRLVLFNNLHLHTPGESFEALAEYYLDEIRRIQPQGPYRLLGWSFGGVLATEMALQLVRSGEQVEHLFLIDPYYDVRRAVADAGLPELPELLDPINYRYAPGKEDLDRLAAAIGSLVLFKAGEPNEITTGPDQNRLFEHYLRSEHNYLDTLLPGHLIRLETLTGQTHHSWVKDPALVAAMGRTIAGLLSGTSDHTHSTEVS